MLSPQYRPAPDTTAKNPNCGQYRMMIVEKLLLTELENTGSTTIHDRVPVTDYTLYTTTGFTRVIAEPR